jgi:hypothetical protein
MAFRAQPKGDHRASEIEIKAKQDALLGKLLGPPTAERYLVSSEIARTLFRVIRKEWPKGAKELTWELPWGRVISSVDPKDTVPEFKLQWKV